ncbi:MAG TPA: SMC-Scp complex subunit ScpB [Terracidiphilus sp.]|nr:SMC-Scp complex subunit ScpB [Terracidiphilus sp.]
MSLKAKLEAVIYAAEEPVTLAQLASLFAADALEWKAEQAAASAEAAETSVGPESQPLLGEELEYLGLEQTPAIYTAVQPEAEAAETASESTREPIQESIREFNHQPAPEQVAEPASAETEAASAEPPLDFEAEAKRLTRQRDREVKAILRQLLDELIAEYTSDGRGVEIREIAGGYRMATKPECHDAVRLFVKSLKPPLKLSLPALETLAVIAYKQPVTAPEVNEIRGVESGGVLGSLLARKLIVTAGRKPVIGRPILYKTTREFLLRFGLKDVSELPSMEEFEKMAAIELEESEAEAEEEANVGGPENPDAGPELDESAFEEREDETAAETSEHLESAPAASAIEAEPAEAVPTDASQEEAGAEQPEQSTGEGAPAEPPPAEQAETEKFPHE